MIFVLAFACFSTFAFSVNAESDKLYEGFKVYDIKVKSEDDLEILRNLENDEGDKRSLDFWSFHHNVDDNVRLMVKPEEQKFVESFLNNNKIEYDVAIENVQT